VNGCRLTSTDDENERARLAERLLTVENELADRRRGFGGSELVFWTQRQYRLRFLRRRSFRCRGCSGRVRSGRR